MEIILSPLTSQPNTGEDSPFRGKSRPVYFHKDAYLNPELSRFGNYIKAKLEKRHKKSSAQAQNSDIGLRRSLYSFKV